VKFVFVFLFLSKTKNKQQTIFYKSFFLPFSRIGREQEKKSFSQIPEQNRAEREREREKEREKKKREI
jgi:hypothetical protein